MIGRNTYAWFAWLPAIILWAFLILIVPFLGLIAFAAIAVGAVAALGMLALRVVDALSAFFRRPEPAEADHTAQSQNAMTLERQWP
jgi:hypothetical protein